MPGASSTAAVSIGKEECWSPHGHGGGDAGEKRSDVARASRNHASPSEESRSIARIRRRGDGGGEEVGGRRQGGICGRRSIG